MNDPVFLAGLIAIFVPFITALVVKYRATDSTKANIASGFALLDAVMVVWLKANADGVDVDWKVMATAIAVAITTQRITYSQFVKPNRLPEKLPAGGLVG